jgi:hypothetical protein
MSSAATAISSSQQQHHVQPVAQYQPQQRPQCQLTLAAQIAPTATATESSSSSTSPSSSLPPPYMTTTQRNDLRIRYHRAASTTTL